MRFLTALAGEGERGERAFAAALVFASGLTKEDSNFCMAKWVKKETPTGTTGFDLFFLLGFLRYPFLTHSHMVLKCFNCLFGAFSREAHVHT